MVRRPRRSTPSPRRGEGWSEGAPERAARGLYPLAVLPLEMPVLRLQQSCPRTDRGGALDSRVACRSRPAGRAGAGARGRLGFLRRRHAVANAARDGGGADRAGARAVAGRARSRNHAGGQPEFGRGGALRRRSRRPGSTGCRSASRRSTRRRCGFSGAGTTATRRSRRSAWRATPFPAILST